MVCIYLKKAYYGVPRQEVWICMREKGVPEKYVMIVQDMYEGARTRVKSRVGITDMIPVGVGLHKGSSLSPYLFAMIMDELARGIKDISPRCMLYADDIVLCGTRSEVVVKKQEVKKGYGRPRAEDKYKENCLPEDQLRWELGWKLRYQSTLQGHNLERVNTFKYLGATMAENGDLDAEMTHRIQLFFFFFRLFPSGVATADFPSPVVSINCIFLRHFNLSRVLFLHINKPPFWPSPFPLSWQLHHQRPSPNIPIIFPP